MNTPETNFVISGKAPGGGGGTATPVTDARILSALIAGYTKAETYRALTQADPLQLMVALLESGVVEAKNRVLQPGPQGEQGPAGIGLTNRREWVSGIVVDEGDYTFHTSSTDATVNSMWVYAGIGEYTSTIMPKGDLAHWTELRAPAGANGKNVELQRNATHLQWRLSGTTTWLDLIALSDIKGLQGDPGKLLELQKTPTHIQYRHVGDGTWNNLVLLSDISGKQIQLQKTATHIQSRYVGDVAWTDLVALIDLMGPAGKNTEWQKSATHLQYRPVGTTTWTDAVALSAITGPQGIQGIQGPAGSIDLTPAVLPLTATTTTFVHDRNKPYKTITASTAGMTTKIVPGAPTGGWQENDMGIFYLKYTAANITITLEGTNLSGFPGTNGNAVGAEHRITYTYFGGKLRFDTQKLEDGTITPPPTGTTRYYAQFDNSDADNIASIIVVNGAAASLDVSASDFTVRVWIKTPANDTGVLETLIEKGNNINNWNIRLTAAGLVQMGTGNTTANQIASSASVANDTWRLLHLVFDNTGSTGTLTGYIDGVQFGQKTGVALPAASTADILFGSRTTSTAAGYGGKMAEPIIYKSKAFTSAEIAADVAGNPPTTNIALRLPLNGNTNDTSGNNNHGTATDITFGSETV